MSTARKVDQLMTLAQYEEWEKRQTVRHEFYQGEVFSQAGGTRRHSQIGLNAAGAIRALLRGRDCIAHGSDMRISIEATGYQAYPDVSVVCPPIEGSSDDVISNPVLLVEVLSPSTADFDPGGKFGHYRQIPSLEEYLVFWQDEPRVEHHTRTAEGNWLLREMSGLDAVLFLQSLEANLPLREVYDKVDFSG
ncbi:MAG: Uma2 family endonuclease [Pirellulales bacterium]